MVGFYIVPPCEADCLVVVEAVDEDKNNIQHLAVTWVERGNQTRLKNKKKRLNPYEVVESTNVFKIWLVLKCEFR